MEEAADRGYRRLDVLIKLLDNPDPKIRALARRELCARAQEAIPKLMEALEVVDENVRFEISKVFIDMDAAALKPMMDAIQHPNDSVRSVAARVLSLIGGDDARKCLEEAARTEKRRTVRNELREASATIARRLEGLEKSSSARPDSASSGLGIRDGLTVREREEKTLYFNIVKNLILSNWAKPRLFSHEAEGDEVLVTLKAARDGSISRVLIENKWQNTSLGESLKDAIRRSAPLPPIPEVIARGKDEIDITFILPVPTQPA